MRSSISCICEVSLCIAPSLSLCSVQRIRRLVILELSSFLQSRVYFVSEFLEALFPSKIILLGCEIVLFEIQNIRDGRPPITIFEHKLVAEIHRYNS